MALLGTLGQIAGTLNPAIGFAENFIPHGTGASIGNAISGVANTYLPQTYSSSHPLLNDIFGQSQAYAAAGNATQPTQAVKGAATQNTPASPPPGGGTSSNPPAQQSTNLDQLWHQMYPNGGSRPVGWNGPSNGGSSTNYDQIKNEIGSGFDSYIQGLQNQYNNLTPEYNDMQSQVNNDYSGQANTLNTQNQTALNNLNASQTQAQLNQSKSLRDLAQQYATQLQGGYNALGAQGAGDSSANQMFGFASQQAARQAQGNLMGQYAGVQNQINLNRNNLGTTYNDQLNQLDNWKNTQLVGLSQWLNDNKSKFQNAIGMSQQQKAQAMAAVDQSALSRLQQLDDQATTFRQSIVNGAMQLQSAGAQAAAYMAAYGKAIPSNYAAPTLNLNTLPQFAPNAGNPAAYNVAGGSAGFYNPNQNQNNPAGGTAGLYYDQNGNPIQ